MRLTEQSIDIIRNSVEEVFGTEASVLLFGSRTDDSARGGDIDLLIQSESPIHDSQRKILQLVARLQRRLGDQPIDVIVLDPQTEKQAIHREALRTGVKL